MYTLIHFNWYRLESGTNFRTHYYNMGGAKSDAISYDDVWRTMYAASSMYNVRCAMYTVHCTLYSVQCTLYSRN